MLQLIKLRKPTASVMETDGDVIIDEIAFGINGSRAKTFKKNEVPYASVAILSLGRFGCGEFLGFGWRMGRLCFITSRPLQ